ncbi:hypothetical protein CFC21_052205 [Triticum aestivum]|uniref:WRC domain-containing protein n=2 Tax=Triticum aestivum TaxID=4565 RepID=A0A9R1G9K7_WHEAT|nr:hypothetical protein CFC21_052205 [Triticum aestivum]
MEQGCREAAVAGRDLQKTGAETVTDSVETLVGGAGVGAAASPRAGSVAAAVDLEEKKVVVADSTVADSAVPVLGVTASSGPSDGPAEAGGEHVDLQKEDLVGKKRKWDSSGYYPYDSDEDEPYEYQSGDDVVEGNVESFEEKEVLKIRAQGSARYYNWRSDKYRCPYYSRPKPRSGLLEHQMEHCRATSISIHDYKIRAQHSALHKVLRNPDM